MGTIRLRLTLWYTALLGLALLGFALTSYWLIARSLHERADASLEDSARAFIATLAEDAAEHPDLDLAALLSDALGEFPFPGQRIAVYDSTGRLLAATTAKDGKGRGLLPTRAAAQRLKPSAGSSPHLATLAAGEGQTRAVAVAARARAQPLQVVVLRSRREEVEVLEQLRDAFLVAIPLTLLLASLGGYLLARRALAPVSAMGRRAERIGAGNLEERLPVANPRDELGRLAAVFNALLERLEAAFAQQRRFMADASHELRTPVAIVRGEAEVTLAREERSQAEYRESLAVVKEEARRLSRIVEDLFTLARADSGRYPLDQSYVYLDELIADCTRGYRSLAAERGIRLSCEAPEGAGFRGDEELLRRMLLNLLDNAAKHTPRGGSISISLAGGNAGYEIEVADTGSGVPAEARSRIFERFFRVDPARSRGDGGAGLGLPIARWVARAHGGELELASSNGAGSAFRVRLPDDSAGRTGGRAANRSFTVEAPVASPHTPCPIAASVC